MLDAEANRLCNAEKYQRSGARIDTRWGIKRYLNTDLLREQDLDQWLHHYKYERPHRGYRNMGRKPIEPSRLGKLSKSS